MLHKNNDNPKTPKTRQQKIEAFLLDPDKAIFETMGEFEEAIASLLAVFQGVDIGELEQLAGKDGKNSVRGVDFFHEEDMKSFEDFILSKIPTVGKELPSRPQVEAFIKAGLAKIPRVKGEDGKTFKFSDFTEAQKKSFKGKDGSSDTGAEIIKKIRGERGNGMLKMADVRGLPKIVRMAIENADELEALREFIENQKVVINNAPDGGSGSGATAFLGLTDTPSSYTGQALLFARVNAAETALEFVAIPGGGDMLKSVYDPTNVLGDAFDMENMVEGATKKILTVAERAAIVANTAKITYPSADSTKVGHITVTQAVDLDQMETDIAALANGMVYKGDWDASLGSFPGAGAAQIGWFYYVSVAGTVDGVAFAVGDNIVAVVDNASAAVYAANWSKHDQTDAVQSVVGLTGSIAKAALLSALNVEDGADVTDATNVASVNAAAASKATPIDADSFPIVNSAAANAIGRVTFTNLKAFLKTYFDTLYATAANTLTFTNKRITSRIGTVASSATPTPAGDTTDQYNVTALAVNATIGAPTGTPTNGQKLIIRIKDNATTRTLAYNSIYRAIGVTLPTATTASKTIYLGCIYNVADTKWDVTAVAEEA